MKRPISLLYSMYLHVYNNAPLISFKSLYYALLFKSPEVKTNLSGGQLFASMTKLF